MPRLTPCISVCVPVYNTEPYLMQCLKSITAQEFPHPLEIVVLNDASHGRDKEGRSAKKIVKEIQKEIKKSLYNNAIPELTLYYLENSHNMQLVEVRRRMVQEASGDYIYMLDSDDYFAPGALSALYDAPVLFYRPLCKKLCRYS